MTRPMPGPPQLIKADALGDWDSDGRWCNRWDIHWEDGRDEFDVLERHDKRLTDAECAAEFWRAEGDHCLASEGYDIDWFSGDLLRDEDIACDVHATWHRFATRPHALDAT